MKKVQEIFKPFSSIIFGALLLLFYLNWLEGSGATLAVGIIAMVVSVFYLAVGITSVVGGNKLSEGAKRFLDAAQIGVFPAFLFVFFLIQTITGASALGPNGWVITVFSLVVSILMALLSFLAAYAKGGSLDKIVQLLSFLFVLVLLLNTLFTAAGNPITLGSVNIVRFVLYFVYSAMLFGSLSSENKTEE